MEVHLKLRVQSHIVIMITLTGTVPLNIVILITWTGTVPLNIVILITLTGTVPLNIVILITLTGTTNTSKCKKHVYQDVHCDSNKDGLVQYLPEKRKFIVLSP